MLDSHPVGRVARGAFDLVTMHDDPAAGANDEAVLARIAELRQEHQDLDASIHALEQQPNADQLRIARIKRRKLALRDLIVSLEDQVTPDIIA